VAHAQGGASGSEAVTAQVDKIFAPFNRPDSSGCALAVIKDGQIVYKRGYGMADLDHDIPIRPDTVFHVASVSKQFAAMAIMLLAKQGKVSLDDKVQKYITELREFDKPITIRHLLHHTSGLRDQWELLIMSGWRLSEDVVRDDDILDLVSRMKALNFPPGDRYVYSNTGYTLAAQIVKRVSGQSLREFAEANTFKPLGMARTFFRDDHAVIVKNQAYAYVGAPNNTFKLSVPNYDTVGASSLLTTVEDLARWDQNFYDYRVGGEDALAQMQTAGKLNGGATTGYGLGLAIGTYKGLKVVEHGGSDAGYRSHLMRIPDQRFSVACLCNLSSSGPSQLARRVVDIYLADRLKPDAPKDNPGGVKLSEKELVKLSEKELSDKAGAYWASDTEELGRVTLTGDKLFFSFDGGYFELIPLSEKRYKILAPDGEVTFESPSDGAPSDGARRMVITLAGRSPVILVALAPATPNAGQLAEYAGFYYSDEIDSIYKLMIQDGKLTVKLKKHGSVEMTPVAKDVFTTAGSGSIRFTRDKQNRVTGLVYSRGRIKNFRFDRLSSQYPER
ncbi:MAG TPA: serine hydrolase domain-containing protein, partial [Blastocatellia bacterium]|nr:serine hydrolase domain-containing protein [Blastocatellia bacterium]